MSNLPLAPRHGNITGKPLAATVHGPCKDLTDSNPNAITPSDAWGSRSIIMPSPQSWVMVCRDHAVRPTGRVKYLLCCVFSCKGAVQRFSANSG